METEIIELLKRIDKKLDKALLKNTSVPDSLKEFLYSKSMYDFVDVQTKVAYHAYLCYKEIRSPEDPEISQTAFNKIIRNHFPDLEIKHTTKEGQQMYLFKLRDN